SRVVIENLDYRECIRKYDSPETWFYLDPPYLGYKGGYVHGDWSEKDYEELYRILRSIKGKWIMNHADHPYIRELFKEFYIIEVECIRSTKRVKKGGKREKYTELLIANYSLQY
ncbi:DNA adenine methylase, partial [Candidatus Woesearchaeota archaeon]